VVEYVIIAYHLDVHKVLAYWYFSNEHEEEETSLTTKLKKGLISDPGLGIRFFKFV
jgi:hypothetical protein